MLLRTACTISFGSSPDFWQEQMMIAVMINKPLHFIGYRSFQYPNDILSQHEVGVRICFC